MASSDSPSNFENSASKSFNAVTTAIIISVVAGVVGLIVVAVVIVIYLKKHGLPSINFHTHTTNGSAVTMPPPFTTIEDSQIRMATVEVFLNDIAREKPIRFSSQQLAGFTRNYTTRLGSGGFGSVYKGELPNGVLVAVKVLNRDLVDKRVEEQFMAEVGTIGRTYHINLVRLYGFCHDATVRALVYEYMENGSLDKHLFDRNQMIPWRKLRQIAIGTAKGIRYLHEECQQRIIHYDIKPGNILLDANFDPKVADFGLAKLLSRENTHVSMTGGRGTPGYAAPEMWMSPEVTEKCDVYSFGMLLLEIVGRRKNFNPGEEGGQEWFPRWVWEKFEENKLGEVASIYGIEEEDREKAERMCKVALWCAQYQPEARPPMSMVVQMLEGEMEIPPPINPFQHLLPYSATRDLWRKSSTGSTASGRTSGTRSNDATPLIEENELELTIAP